MSEHPRITYDTNFCTRSGATLSVKAYKSRINASVMSYTKNIIHIVFGTHLRKPSIAVEHERELYAYVLGITRNLGSHLYRIGGMPDHLHIVADISSKISLTEFVKTIKQSSSAWMKANHDFPLWDGWAEGYAAFSCSADDFSDVVEYVKGQKEHHKKVSFRDEYRKFLDDTGIKYDERYLP